MSQRSSPPTGPTPGLATTAPPVSYTERLAALQSYIPKATSIPTGIPPPRTFKPNKADVMETMDNEFGPSEDDPSVTPEEKQAWESWRKLKGSNTVDEDDAYEVYQKLRRKRLGLE